MMYGISIHAKDFELDLFLDFVTRFPSKEFLGNKTSNEYPYVWSLWGTNERENENNPPHLYAGTQGIKLYSAFGKDNNCCHAAQAIEWILERHICSGFTIDDDWPQKSCNHEELQTWAHNIGLRNPYLNLQTANTYLMNTLQDGFLYGVHVVCDQISLFLSVRKEENVQKYSLTCDDLALSLGEEAVIKEMNTDDVFIGFETIYKHIMNAKIVQIAVKEQEEISIQWDTSSIPWHIRNTPQQALKTGDTLWELREENTDNNTPLLCAFLNQGIWEHSVKDFG